MLWLIAVILYVVTLGLPFVYYTLLAVVGGYYRQRDMWRAIEERKRIHHE